MASTAIESIGVSDVDDLRRIAEEVRESGRPRTLRVGDEDLAVLVPVESADLMPHRQKTQYDYDAFRSAAGGWRGIVDGKKLKRDTAAARGSDRPPVDLGPDDVSR